MRVLFVFLFLLLPDTTFAQGFVQCAGPDCTFCSLMDTLNAVLAFIIQIAIIGCVIIIAWAGLKMVVSRGNPGAWKAAKESMMNVIIGIVIILLAFTLVDVLLKITIGGDFGVWNEIETDDCGEQNVAGDPVYGITLANHSVPPLDDPGTVYGPNGGYIINYNAPGYMSPGGGSAPVEAVACDTSQLETIDNYMRSGQSLTVHRSFIPSLRRIEQRWLARGGDSWYNIYYVGGYSCRPNVNNPREQSKHAFGLAVDINDRTNPNVPKQTPCPSDMPSDFVNLFRAEGWGWGGAWRSGCDAMHFSKATNEGGNMLGG